MTPQIQIFISHVSEDEIVALALKDFLEGIYLSAEVFVSGRDLSGGQVWIEELRSRLERSTAIIALITSFSKNSEWVHFEGGAGFVKGSTIPLVTDDVKLSGLAPPFSLLQAREFNQSGLQKLCEDISRKAGQRVPDHSPAVRTTVDKVSSFISERSKASSSPQVNVAKQKRIQPLGAGVHPDLHAQHERLVSRARDVLRNEIKKRRPVYDLPADDDIDKLDLEDLRELGGSVGVNLPLSLLNLATTNFLLPKKSDPDWKIKNGRSRLESWEKIITDLEKRD
ncbi:MAG: toll/interleukin-1 receptor domain-containing protein [Prosthecobacter sp.]